MKVIHLILLTTLLILSGNFLIAQTPKSVCEIVNAPLNGDYVATTGEVTSVPSDDDFYISSNGCTIKCDGDEGNLPTVGDIVIVYGRVEVEDGDELEIDVQQWVKQGGGNPNPPTPSPTVTTVAQALQAAPGTVVEITGSVTSYTDLDDGEGFFSDGADQIKIDFEGNNAPSVGQSVVVLGTIEFDDGQKEIDVYHWYPSGGTPPGNLPGVVWYIGDAQNASVGTFVVAGGEVSSWTNQTDGEGEFVDNSSNILIDFEDNVTNPNLNQIITVFGVVGTENGQPEIEAHDWVSGNLVNVYELKNINVSIYPQPCDQILNVVLSRVGVDVVVYNSIGVIMFQKKSVQVNTEINVQDWPEGMYLVKIISGESFSSFPIIKN